MHTGRIFLCLMLVGYGLTEMDSVTKQRITTAINTGQNILDFVGKFGNSKSPKLFDAIGKMSGFLGAAGGVLSLAMIFVPNSDSIELTYMKEKFSEINMKLDEITEELDHIQNLITFENQRSVYLSHAEKILYGYGQFIHFLQDVIEVNCTSETDCLRKRIRIAESYEQAFNIKQHVHGILKGTVAGMLVFGDPLLDLVKTTYKCDVSKIDQFANGVLKLAFKGQSVILAHEKLTGSNYSVVTSMRDWLNLVYDLRSKANEVKNDCYKNIKAYMIQDINDTKYQVNVDSNEAAVVEMKQTLDNKYPWVHWVIFSYGAYGGHQHWTLNKDGSFWNMPKNQNDRRRNIIAVAQDKGTYLKQRVEFAAAIESAVETSQFLSLDGGSAREIHNAISEKLKKSAIWRYIKSFTVLKSYDDLKSNIDADHHLYWYDEKLAFTTCGIKHCGSTNARIIAVFRSQEEIDGVECRMTCNLHGTCRRLPLTTTEYCECQPFYQGETCENKTRVELALNAATILSETFQIPKLTDVYFEIKDVRDFLGSSLNEVLSAVNSLEQQMEKSFDDLEKKIQWSRLSTQYADAIKNLKYFFHMFRNLPTDNEESALVESKKLASRILSLDGVQKWLFELNFLFVGRSDFSLGEHKPLLMEMMDNLKDSACSKSYKDALDDAWRQLVLLQSHGFLMWTQALDIENKPSDWVVEKFKERLKRQISKMNETTCEIQIDSSSNLQSCVNGYYLYPGLIIENRCKPNYYIEGSSMTECKSNTSSCKECGCNPQGATSMECSDFSGICTCNKNNFKGNKCYDRDCLWSSWQSWRSCSKSCDYGGSQVRKRTTVVEMAGNGQSCSAGRNINSRTCFNGCCSGQYHCSWRRKCIPSYQKCDYKNDCGDYQDELSCSESCTTKYTSYRSMGGWLKRSAGLEHHQVNCGGSQYVLKSFNLERNGNNIRYRYVCCRLTSDVVSLRYTDNGYTDARYGDTCYLQRQSISCGSYGFINDFRLVIGSGEWRYSYYCSDVESSRRSKVRCYYDSTGYIKESGKLCNIDRQHVSCRGRYFLSYFKLENELIRKNVWGKRIWKFRYDYKCCRIDP